MLKSNRGEWSEVYAFLRILADGEMKPADAALREMVGRPAISVARILREEKNSLRISYYAGDPIRAEFDNGESFVEVERARVSNEADALYREIMDRANAINTSSKLKDRIALLERSCGLSFECTAHPAFDRNMRLIDSFFPKLMAGAVLRFYSGKGARCLDIIEDMERDDALRMGKGMYEYKFKKFLCAVALGMTPAREWNGRDDATGGYVVVRNDGKVLAFHIYNRDIFEDYLLDNTKFETASLGKHNFGRVYERSVEYFINLNLQIRFR